MLGVWNFLLSVVLQIIFPVWYLSFGFVDVGHLKTCLYACIPLHGKICQASSTSRLQHLVCVVCVVRIAHSSRGALVSRSKLHFANDIRWTSFHPLTCHLSVFFGDMSVQAFCPFLIRVVIWHCVVSSPSLGGIFQLYFCNFISGFIPLWSGSQPCVISILLDLSKCVLWPTMWS